MKEPCVLEMAEVQYPNTTSAQGIPEYIECELGDKDRPDGRGKRVKVAAINRTWFMANSADSSFTTIFVSGAIISRETDDLVLPENPVFEVRNYCLDAAAFLNVTSQTCSSNSKLSSRLQIGNITSAGGDGDGDSGDSGDNGDSDGNRRVLTEASTTTGVKTVLVIRAKAADSETTRSEAAISGDVFGNNEDPISLKSQFNDCSNGALTFTKVTGNEHIGSSSVITVDILDQNVKNVDNAIVRNVMRDQAQKDLKVADLGTVADYVMFCVPPGTAGSWVAYVSVELKWVRLFVAAP